MINWIVVRAYRFKLYDVPWRPRDRSITIEHIRSGYTQRAYIYSAFDFLHTGAVAYEYPEALPKYLKASVEKYARKWAKRNLR